MHNMSKDNISMCFFTFSFTYSWHGSLLLREWVNKYIQFYSNYNSCSFISHNCNFTFHNFIFISHSVTIYYFKLYLTVTFVFYTLRWKQASVIIYIYAFARWFYPKRLALHSRSPFEQFTHSLGSEPMDVALRAHALMFELHACSYLFLVKKIKKSMYVCL